MKMRAQNYAVPGGIKSLVVAVTIALWMAVAWSATAGSFVSFQPGNLRIAYDWEGISINGRLLDAAYNIDATCLRSDQASSSQNGAPLLVGNNDSATYRTILSFDVSYLTNLAGGDLSRIDSAALILTHDSAGAGGSSTHSVHLTLPFDEATATWNDPDGTGTNAGGFVGPELRERGNVGTRTSPVQAVWGSPGWYWPDSGTGPDGLVEAVRAAVTNSPQTLHLLLKRKAEGANTYFSRFQDDSAPDVNLRPQLLVGVDNDLSLLAAYYFNENDNTAATLDAVAAATLPDPERVTALNATAGSGLGTFGAGGSTGNGHGYGTGAYVSAPSGFYARASASAGDESSAVTGNSYVSFTLAPHPGYAINFSAIMAQAKLQAATFNTAHVVVRSSLDNFTVDLASLSVPGNDTAVSFTPLMATFDDPEFVGVVQPVEFRLYLFDDTDTTGEFMRLDDVMFYGAPTPPPSGVQIITLTATDSSATESGNDPGAFTLQRYGDTSGPATVTYTLSGTASNGVDYESLSGSVAFAAGATNVTIPVVPLDDNVPEPEETVILTLNTNAAYIIAGPTTATVRIADDNDPPEFTVEATKPSTYESGLGLEGEFTIHRVLGDTNSAVAVQFTLGGTADNGVDYTTSATNSIQFEPGITAKTITITPLDDAELEGNETVVLHLESGDGYTVGSADSAIVTLIDDEAATNASLLLEAESLAERGGWVVDQQFVDRMGSPYLLAHGKGYPVADAVTTAQFPAPGAYRLWVRTKDWTAPRPDHPGAFTVAVDGVEAGATFGTVGQSWLWQDGGLVIVAQVATEVRLHDLTGFEGRCDALFFTTDMNFVPPNSLPELTTWRRAQLGIPDVPPSAGNFDLVVVGGGIAGCAASIAAARQGLQVALIHDRPFPGGNASQDVRVHTLGDTMGGIVTEINTPDFLIGSDQFIQTDQARLQVLLAETNLHLFTEWRAFAANTNGSRIISIDAKHTRTGEERRFFAPVFIDSTGDGWIGYWAGALYRTGREPRAAFNESLAPVEPDSMRNGSTLSWNSRNTGKPVTFPAVPWAMGVAKDYYQTRGDWYWEYGLLSDTIYDAEEIRDHLLQAIYGTWSNVKQRAGNENLDLDWVAYISGKRESRRLVGDYVLTESDVRNHPFFEDAVVTESREIDLHYTRPGDYDFLTYAQFTGISPYWIPFRCLYSTNVDNLMMAGRCLSATHVGLGSPRVMNTCGQMGVATGNAAALCKQYNTSPRGVYQSHIAELQGLIGLNEYFGTPDQTVTVLDNADTNHVQLVGDWTSSTSNSGFYRADYLHDGNTGKGTKSVTFQPDLPLRGWYRVYLRWTASNNRATNVPVDVHCTAGVITETVNEQIDAGNWYLLGTYLFDLGNAGSVVIRTTDTTLYVIADAVVFAADFPIDPTYTGMPWEDEDADGVCNYVEWLNGTDPDDPLSNVKVNLQSLGGFAVLHFVTMANQSYTVQYRDSLTTGHWQSLTNLNASPLTREIQITDPLPISGEMRFYRLVATSAP